MSLTALAVRFATIRALQGRTFAEDRVFDSKINPVNLVASKESKPVIIVTTDDDNIDITGKGLRAGNHKLELVIEIAVTQKVTVEVENGDTTEVITIPSSDAGLEATVGLIGWQIAKALSADGGYWGDIWRTLVTNVHSISSRRGADDENGVRYAARQYIYSLDHVEEPTPGESPCVGSAWDKVLIAMKADADYAGVAKLIEAEITGGDYLPWQIARGHLGVADDVAVIMGTKPVKIDEIVQLAAVDLTDGFTIAEQRAGELEVPENEA
ncbi:hypothetical protein HNQ68_001968 [Pseudochrobactrum saccharolyticum]|uniref:Uncharacterized protein n=1 Tax=Pseudochrobactrum saccharolyticum TaxID=354352 RepID=A0A7W8EQI1_9HYPH|nr:hypothetical protein [Pseudochrobactrum saccharolyticum]KAB0538190.1 hypothetical protein F7P81_10735 [Pseudochrobactrum saccharolyticum]MBB5091427.1 hypothetical protein [Pseudochrobactrum saccharolyticum]